jgi:thiamine-monophosphate kinase
MSGPGEFDLIAQIRARAPGHPSVVLGIGDDCAVLRPKDGRLEVVTTDMLMDGRHFVLAEAGPEAVGVKAMGVNLSDIAAMAAEPVAAFVSVALPRHNAASIADGLMAGLTSMARPFGVALAGGDTNAWDGPLVVCVTVIGRCGPAGPVTRSGAKPGHAILVTGPLGGSLLGRHLRPEPRIREALQLRSGGHLHAMIDLSDGLSSDLRHVLAASGNLGATIDADAVPIHDDAQSASARDGRSPLAHALHDGEDFELCLTMPEAQARAYHSNPDPGLRLYRIGTVEPNPGVWLRAADGTLSPLPRGGFDHLGSEPAS